MKIECTLSAKSLLSAADKLKKYAESLDDKSDKLVKALGEMGAERAMMHFDEGNHKGTGNTRGSIMYEHEGNSGTVSVGGAAVWIEFGTGVMRNSGAAHPKKDELGMVGWGEYGDGHGADPNGWDFFKDGYKYHTFGITMHPFMYETSQDLRNELLKKAKEVFKVD